MKVLCASKRLRMLSVVLYISKEQFCAFCWFDVCRGLVIANARTEHCKVQTADTGPQSGIASHSFPHFAVFIVHSATALYVKSSNVCCYSQLNV
jgi:hypothetical protein